MILSPASGDLRVFFLKNCDKVPSARSWSSQNEREFGVLIKGLTVAICFIGFLAAEAAGPERKVEGNVIVSERDPKVRIELPKSARYIGADRFVLYEIADCELHLFVEADSQRNINRLYWVQFEAYLPTRPDLHHLYDSPRHTAVGGLDFYVDTWVATKDEKTTPGSDLEHVQTLIGSHSYTMPAGMTSVRLVHLLDEQKRKELMIIYAEDLTPSGFAPAELKKGAKAYDQWSKIEKDALDHAVSAIKLETF
jgi:hypothetical protein